jgi:hypothetical protein
MEAVLDSVLPAGAGFSKLEESATDNSLTNCGPVTAGVLDDLLHETISKPKKTKVNRE